MTAPPVYGTGLMLLLPADLANRIEALRVQLGVRTTIEVIRYLLDSVPNVS